MGLAMDYKLLLAVLFVAVSYGSGFLWDREDPLLATVRDDNVHRKVHFWYHTSNAVLPVELIPGTRNELLKSRINLPIKILTHGFLENGNSRTLSDVRRAFLNRMDVNVIQVDWSRGAVMPIYSTPQKNTRAVGRYLGSLVDFLISEGADPKNIHLIGHSLGAHVSGFAGAATTLGKVGRITGLDPAGPRFYDAAENMRLNPSNADFVDCIHTAGGRYGIGRPICHADFFPNGGGNPQPGCTLLDTGICSHSRAVEFFTESLDPNQRFEALSCDNSIAIRFWPVGCVRSSFNMGLFLDPSARGSFFLRTATRSPFALPASA